VGSFRLLSDAFLAAHPEEAAAVIEELDVSEAAAFLAEATPSAAARAFERMVATYAGECLARVARDRAVDILNETDLYAAVSILRAMDGSVRQELVEAVETDTAAALRSLLRYPEGTAGAVMDPRIKAMPSDITVGEALARLRSAPGRVLDYIYVVDRDGVLTGVLNMRELMSAPVAQPLIAAAYRRISRFSAHATRETIVSHPRWRDVHALPVTDDAGRLLGAVRYGTFRRLEEEDAIERRHHHPSVLVVAFAQVYWLALLQVLPLVGDVFVRLLRPAALRERRSEA
jgi:magnesium transporter